MARDPGTGSRHQQNSMLRVPPKGATAMVDPFLGVSVTKHGESIDAHGKKTTATITPQHILDQALVPVLGVPFTGTTVARAIQGKQSVGSIFTDPFKDRPGELVGGMAPVPFGRLKGPYKPRTLKVNDLEQQLPKARSRITQTMIEKPADKASAKLEKSRVAKVPGVRLGTTSERAVKAAGRAQRRERSRTTAGMHPHLDAIKQVKAGSAEDTANFWYAQLPKSHRNVQGLKAVQEAQRQHLEELASGKALADANRRERALSGKIHALSLGHDVEEVAPDMISPGVVVHAADANNYGRVVSVNGDTATVHFLNRKEGTEATVNLPLSQLTSSGLRLKPGAAAATAESRDVFPLLKQLEDVKLFKSDIPNQIHDVSASMAHLDDVIAKAPKPNDAAIAAVHALSNDSANVLIDAGRLNPARVEPRKGLVADWLGLKPTGDEAFIGHRMPKPDTRFPYTPKGGTGRVATPAGMTSQNKLVLAKNGRLRPSLHVASEDWASTQVFRQANVARDTLGKIGTPFTGHVPADAILVNPKGRTVPPGWKNEDLAQFTDSYEDVDHIRNKAQQIVDEFSAHGSDPAAVERIKQQALQQGVKWDELRVVPRRLVERYYDQFRPSTSRGKVGKTYDTMVDAVATSIVFARAGYIPKNIVQNLIMAMPHQGPLFLRNAVWAAQAMRDPELRTLLRAEVGHGANAAIGQEALHKKAIGGLANFVGSVADDPIRISAFLHEASGANVLNGAHALLTAADKQNLLRLLKTKGPLLNDINTRSNEAMADFTRLTPDQSRIARRVLIVPGWLMAGTRYPFHFTATHPIRSALLAYIAMGEPGAPDQLQFNKPLDEYFTGSSYKRGIDTPYGRFRTSSLSPVSTPWEIGGAAVATARGKTNPFDFSHQTVWDYANPLLAAGVSAAQGGGIGRSAERLAPNYSLVHDLIAPSAGKNYPEDATRVGRLKREVGVVPIRVNDDAPKHARRRRKPGGSDSMLGDSSSSDTGSMLR